MSATSASYRPERKGEVADLQRLLQNIQVKRDRRKLKEVIKKVIAYLTLGVDVSRLFSEMVMACQSAEVVIKKMVYLFLTYYARAKSDLAILAINTLRKDLIINRQFQIESHKKMRLSSYHIQRYAYLSASVRILKFIKLLLIIDDSSVSYELKHVYEP